MAIGAVDKGFSDHLTVSSRYFSLTLGMALESVWIQQRFFHVIGADLLAGEEEAVAPRQAGATCAGRRPAVAAPVAAAASPPYVHSGGCAERSASRTTAPASPSAGDAGPVCGPRGTGPAAHPDRRGARCSACIHPATGSPPRPRSADHASGGTLVRSGCVLRGAWDWVPRASPAPRRKRRGEVELSSKAKESRGLRCFRRAIVLHRGAEMGDRIAAGGHAAPPRASQARDRQAPGEDFKEEEDQRAATPRATAG